MKYSLTLVLISIISFGTACGQNFFSEVDAFLGEYVSDGAVDYAAIQQNPEKLNSLVSNIASYSLDLKTDPEKKAFYINAYNVLVIHGVIGNYPINSPLDKDGFFDKVKYNVAGEKLTLNEIENNKLRAEYKDPRIHFVLVCAAISCPELIPKAYFPSTLDSQIESRTKASLDDSDFIRVGDGKIKLSEIFKWYADDFGGKENYRSFINTYRDEKLPAKASIEYYTYDWTLNVKK